MKFKLILTAALLVAAVSLFAQKKALTNDSYKSFELLKDYEISPDGKYCWYSYGVGAPEEFSYVLYKVENGKTSRFTSVSSIFFSSDSKKLVYQSSADSLVILDLPSGSKKILSQTQLIPPLVRNPKDDILLFNNGDGATALKLGNGYMKKFGKVTNVQVNPSGTMITFLKDNILHVADLFGADDLILAEKGDFSAVTFDKTNSSLAFANTIGDRVDIYAFKKGWSGARRLVGSGNYGKDSDCVLSDQIVGFSVDGSTLYFKTRVKNRPLIKQAGVISEGVDVWGYKDFVDQHVQQELSREDDEMRLAAVSLEQPEKVLQIENGERSVWAYVNPDALAGRYLLTSNFSRKYFDLIAKEGYYRSFAPPQFHLLSIASGTEKEIDFGEFDPEKLITLQVSPNERYITWFDRRSRSVFWYEIATGETHKYEFSGDAKDLKVALDPYIDTWQRDEKAFYVRDGYDIWKISTQHNVPPVCITNQFGRKHRICFDISTQGASFSHLVSSTQRLILKGLRMDNYENGFWQVNPDRAENPVELNSYKGLVDWSGIMDGQKKLLKAKNATAYLVTRQTASDAPNLFFTKDLVHYNQISHITPQKEYNWLQTELIQYPLSDAKVNRAILYKPENFDPHKKYPTIFHYYEFRSNELYQFKKPGLSGGNMNIPWYVSNGYVVCVVDIINEEPLKLSKKTVDVLESAVRYLSQYPWLDASKMGIQGHSFGGYETLLIAAGSRQFAAAQSSAGVSDNIGALGDHRFNAPLYAFWETGQHKMGIGVLPWSHTDVFIEHSPFLKADKFTTPLLLQNNKEDGFFYPQGVQMYGALRRLQKPVWMLQYDNEDHVLADEGVMLDFTIRQEQFFDHYLKDKPAPLWMTEGVPYKYKGLRSGLQLDNTGKQP